MTIGIDASRANRKRKTGVEWYGYELINALKNIPLADNDIVLYSDSKLNDNLVQLPKNWISSILKWPLNRLWTVVRLSYEMLVRSPSLLFVPSHILPFIIPKYSVVTLHDIGFVRHPGFYSTLALFYHKFSAKLVIKRASKIIAPSEFTKTELVDFYKCAPNKIIVIPHGINWDQKIISDHARQRVLNKYSLVDGFTKKYKTHMLVYFEQTDSVECAIIREKQLKKWNRDWKLKLIEESNHNWIDLSDDWIPDQCRE